MAKGKRNRTKIDITYSVLYTARNGALKSHLMREANLNSAQIARMLDNLVRNGLISIKNDGGSSLYQTTPTGVGFIRSYEDLLGLMGQPVGDGRKE